MLPLHVGTFWQLRLRCFEIEYFCFGLDWLILPCDSNVLHLAIYFGKVESLFEGSVFLSTTLKTFQRLFLLAFNFN